MMLNRQLWQLFLCGDSCCCPRSQIYIGNRRRTSQEQSSEAGLGEQSLLNEIRPSSVWALVPLRLGNLPWHPALHTAITFSPTPWLPGPGLSEAAKPSRASESGPSSCPGGGMPGMQSNSCWAALGGGTFLPRKGRPHWPWKDTRVTPSSRVQPS